MVKFDAEGNRRQSQPKPADDRLPFRPPGQKCNARLARGVGYCTNPAGAGTDHTGYGRCKLHGGILRPSSDTHDDGPLAMWKAAGLEQIINMAETMTGNDQEYLYHVGNNSLVVIRSGIVARLAAFPPPSPKEMADLTMSLTRIDAILAKYPDEENPNAPRMRGLEEAEEMARLSELEAQLREENK